MSPCSGTDQSAETTTLKGHTWKADKYSTGLPLRDFQKNTLKIGDLAPQLSLWSMPVPFPIPFLKLRFPYLSLSSVPSTVLWPLYCVS